jgi:lantibiotic modifying enzyme
LLCVLHALAAADCHFQNLVACSEYPVIVDAETLFQPRLADSELSSLMRTGMVPLWVFGPQGQEYDVSALGCIAPRSTHLRVPKWNGAEVEFEFGVLVPRENVPFPLTGTFTPRSYVEEMVSGFAETYRFLAGHRHQLMAQIHKVRGLPVRYLVRDTVEYYETISEMLQSPTECSVALRPLPGSHAVFRPLQQDERLALERLDIPRFTLPANSRNLSGVKGCFRLSGFAVAAERIERLCEQDLERQVNFLRLAWNMSRVSELLP